MEENHIKIAQLTDLHLLNSKMMQTNSVNPYAHVESILNEIEPDKYDYLFLSGDISENGSTESYELIRDLLANYDTPTYCIPGNHDNKTNMHATLVGNQNIKLCDKLSIPDWDIFFLDTAVENEPHGFLTEAELENLQANIKNSNANNICIVMHHHPYPIGNPYVDSSILQNADMLSNIIDKTNVKFVTFGHVHNYYKTKVGAISFESTPATSFQIKKGVDGLTVETNFAFKELLFYQDKVISNCIWKTYENS